jgi:hypothetical protein
MNWTWAHRFTRPKPHVIEIAALISAIVVLLAGGITIAMMPHEDFTRDKILTVLNVVVLAFGVASLLFLWAQLRHTATQDKLVAYHEYFQDLPRSSKVSALYAAMGRLNIDRPVWQKPLTTPERDVILHDDKPAPETAHIAIREYLNDFEEFAAAVNSGLVDFEYAYHIESARVLNAYYGFEELITFWLLEDQQKAVANRAAGVAPSDYYGELKKLADRWKARKLAEVAEENQNRERRGISNQFER